MTIGILGAGNIGSALAHQFARAGIETLIANRRGADALRPLLLGLGDLARAATLEETARQPVVVIALPWKALPAVLGGLPNWDGRIVIDTTNAIAPPDFRPVDLGGRPSSEVVAELVPGARLVKAFNTLRPEILAADPHHAGGRRVMFYSGNDPVANGEVGALISRLGFAGIDLGRLDAGGRLQQFPGGVLPAIDLIRMD